MIGGVYKITNLANNKIYIGSTTRNPTLRQKHHFYMLKLNKHCNKHLQRAYNKYGKDSFSFEIIEKCNSENSLILEEKWISILDSTNSKIGYNILKTPTKGNLGYKVSNKTKRILSKAFSGKNNPMYGKTKEEAAFFGRKHSLNTKEKMSESAKGHKRNLGKVQNKDWIFKRTKPKGVYKYDLNMNFIEKYESLKEAALANNLKCSSSITLCCKGVRKFSAGFIWRYEKDIKE